MLRFPIIVALACTGALSSAAGDRDEPLQAFGTIAALDGDALTLAVGEDESLELILTPGTAIEIDTGETREFGREGERPIRVRILVPGTRDDLAVGGRVRVAYLRDEREVLTVAKVRDDAGPTGGDPHEGGGDGGDDEEEEDEERVALGDVPAAVRTAAAEAVPGIRLTSAERETEDGATVYELEGTVDGREWEIEISADGEVLETETEDDDEEG